MFKSKSVISSMMVLLLALAYGAAFILTDATFAVCGAPGAC